MSPQPRTGAGEAAGEAAGAAAGAAERNIDELAQQVRELNEQIIAAGRRSGEAYLRTYEQMLKSVADLQEEAGKASPWDWVTAMATAQANFTRDIAEAYAAAGRRLQGG